MREEYRTLIAVVEEKGFTRAARAVNLSQPAVSAHVKRLEASFNTVLVDRSDRSKDIAITRNGMLVYELAKRVLAAEEEVRSAILNNDHPEAERLRIGATQTVGNYYLPPLISRYSWGHEKVKLEIIVENTAQIAQMLHEGQLDIALIEGKSIKYSFKRVDFAIDELILVGNANLAGHSAMTHVQLEQQLWLSREEGSGTCEYMKDYLETNAIAARDILVLGSNFAIKEALLNGIGITLISESVVRDELMRGLLARLPMRRRVFRHFSYLLPKGCAITPSLKWFISILEQNGAGR